MINTGKRIRDEIMVRTTGRFVEGQTELDLLSEKAICRLFRERAKRALEVNDYPPLSKDEERLIRSFYEGAPRTDMIYHRVFKGRTGVCDPAFMPDDLYYGYIEPYYNDREAARYLDNKALYYTLFRGAKLPEAICVRVGSLWFDGQGQPVPNRRVLELIREAADAELTVNADDKGTGKPGGELVLKRAENSEGGAGVFFLDRDDPANDFRRRMRRIPGDVVVQRGVVQHPDLAKLHPESANTLRVMSILKQDGAQILTTCVRIGAGGCRTDNLSSGGLFVGIDEEGRTKGLGAMHDGIMTKEHPTMHYPLAGHPVPGIASAHAMVKKLHPVMGRFRLASWDIAVDEEGEAVLLETNVSLSVISDIQACAGPLFGDQTRKIVEEVFGL